MTIHRIPMRRDATYTVVPPPAFVQQQQAAAAAAAKLRAATGWAPRHSLDSILEELIRAASH